MAIDFEVEPEFQKQIDWVRNFVEQEIEPLDQFMSVGRDKQGNRIDADGWQAIRAYIKDLQQQVKEQGLWGFHLGPDLGRRHALVQPLPALVHDQIMIHLIASGESPGVGGEGHGLVALVPQLHQDKVGPALA